MTTFSLKSSEYEDREEETSSSTFTIVTKSFYSSGSNASAEATTADEPGSIAVAITGEAKHKTMNKAFYHFTLLRILFWDCLVLKSEMMH